VPESGGCDDGFAGGGVCAGWGGGGGVVRGGRVGMGSRRLASLREVRDGVCFLGWMQVFKWSE
jgi:hypothetical protein